ncbi:hypothetical protein A2U01_0052141, partial [Trifolium medium]|nr:hypothetical protein [Trifolium medium]
SASGVGASEVRTSGNVATSVSNKEKIPKKQRTQKKKATKIVRKWVIQEEDEEETDEESLQCKRKRAESGKVQPEPKRMHTEAETCNSHFLKDNVTNSQAQTPPITSPVKQPLSETNDDIDPSLLKPINIVHPPQTSDLPPITTESDLDTVAEGIKIA